VITTTGVKEDATDDEYPGFGGSYKLPSIPFGRTGDSPQSRKISEQGITRKLFPRTRFLDSPFLGIMAFLNLDTIGYNCKTGLERDDSAILVLFYARFYLMP